MEVKLLATISVSFDPTNADQAGELCDALGLLATELKKRGVSARVNSPDVGPDQGDDDDLMPGPAPAQTQAQTNGQDKEAPPKRVRDRTAERRAAREKAEAEARAKAPPPGHQGDDPLLDAGGGGSGGDPFGDDDEMLPPGPDPKPAPAVQDKVRTPKECMDGSLVVLRQCFRAPGGAEAVKALQKEYKISKFAELPEAVAPGLWKQAVALAVKLNVEIPAGL